MATLTELAAAVERARQRHAEATAAQIATATALLKAELALDAALRGRPAAPPSRRQWRPSGTVPQMQRPTVLPYTRGRTS